MAVNPKDRKVIIVESILTPTKFRTALVKVLFNYFEVPAIAFVPNHLMSLMTLICHTALVVDVGYSECSVTPVVEGITMVDSIAFSSLGGKAIHQRIRDDLIKYNGTISQNGSPFVFNKSALEDLSEETIEDMKVRTCFIPSFSRGQQLIQSLIDDTQPENKPNDVKYPMEGERALKIPGIIREASAQVIFEPKGNEATISSLILDVIQKSPVDVRKTLASNIVLTGGTVMMTGFKRRLKQELENLCRIRKLTPEMSCFKFHSLPCPANYSSWLGGAIFGSTEAAASRMITKKQIETVKGVLISDWNSWTPN